MLGLEAGREIGRVEMGALEEAFGRADLSGSECLHQESFLDETGIVQA